MLNLSSVIIYSSTARNSWAKLFQYSLQFLFLYAIQPTDPMVLEVILLCLSVLVFLRVPLSRTYDVFREHHQTSPRPTEVGIDKARQTPVRVIVKFIRRLHPNLVLLPSVLKSCCTTPEMLSNFVAAVKSL